MLRVIASDWHVTDSSIESPFGIKFSSASNLLMKSVFSRLFERIKALRQESNLIRPINFSDEARGPSLETSREDILFIFRLLPDQNFTAKELVYVSPQRTLDAEGLDYFN